MRAYGSLLFLRSECVVGTVLSVDLIYFGGQFAYGEGVAELYDRVSQCPSIGAWLSSNADSHWQAS